MQWGTFSPLLKRAILPSSKNLPLRCHFRPLIRSKSAPIADRYGSGSAALQSAMAVDPLRNGGEIDTLVADPLPATPDLFPTIADPLPFFVESPLDSVHDPLPAVGDSLSAE